MLRLASPQSWYEVALDARSGGRDEECVCQGGTRRLEGMWKSFPTGKNISENCCGFFGNNSQPARKKGTLRFSTGASPKIHSALRWKIIIWRSTEIASWDSSQPF